MPFCRYCAKEIHETASVCPHCGAAQGIDIEIRRKGTVFLAVASLAIGLTAALITITGPIHLNPSFSRFISLLLLSVLAFVLGTISLWKRHPAMGSASAGVVFAVLAFVNSLDRWNTEETRFHQRNSTETSAQMVRPSAAATTIAPPAEVADQSSDQTWGPSFDCSKVTSGSERLICSNKQLAEADVRLSKAYAEYLTTVPDKEVAKNQQLFWIKDIRDACSTAECMLNAYAIRIAKLAP